MLESTSGTLSVEIFAVSLSWLFPALSTTLVFTWYSVSAAKFVNVWVVSVLSVSVTQSPHFVSDVFFIAYSLVFTPDFPYIGAVVVAAPSSCVIVALITLDVGANFSRVGADVVGFTLSTFVIFNVATPVVWAPSHNLAYAVPLAVNINGFVSVQFWLSVDVSIVYPFVFVATVTFTLSFVQSVVSGVKLNTAEPPWVLVSTLGTLSVVIFDIALSCVFPALSVTCVFTWYSVFAAKLLNVCVAASVTQAPQLESDVFLIAYWIVPSFNPDCADVDVFALSCWLNVAVIFDEVGFTFASVGAVWSGFSLSIWSTYTDCEPPTFVPSVNLANTCR